MIENGGPEEEEKDPKPKMAKRPEEILKLNQFAKMQQALEKENF